MHGLSFLASLISAKFQQAILNDCTKYSWDGWQSAIFDLYLAISRKLCQTGN